MNPRIVFCTISGYGMTGPYRDMPSHGIAYDVWAGIVQPEDDDDGFAYMPEHVSIGINAGPVVRRARPARRRHPRARDRRGLPARDRAVRRRRRDRLAALRDVAGVRAARVRGHRQRGRQLSSAARRAPPAWSDGVRYQFYETNDGHVLFMASEREFWKNFCEGIGRPDLFERWPGFAVRRPRRRQRRAARRSCATSSCSARAPSGSSSANGSTRRSHREHAEDDRRRSAVPGPDAVAPRATCSAATAAVADQVRRRDAADADARRRPSGQHTDDGPARRPRLRRRPHRRVAVRRRARLTFSRVRPDRRATSTRRSRRSPVDEIARRPSR